MDDLTVRTGRVVDGKFYTDSVADQAVRDACAKGSSQVAPQSPESAMEAGGLRIEAVLWTTGAAEGFVLLAAQELDHTLEPGEVRSGLETAACDCGAVETSFLSVGGDRPCETCGVSKAPEVSDGCFSCGSVLQTRPRKAGMMMSSGASSPGLGISQGVGGEGPG